MKPRTKFPAGWQVLFLLFFVSVVLPRAAASGNQKLSPSTVAAPDFRLAIAIAATNTVVSWPQAASGSWLEITDRLAPAGRWWPAWTLTSARDGLTIHTERFAPGQRFFRLADSADLVGWVETTAGPVAAEKLGMILPHEHIFTDLRGPTTTGFGQADADDVVRVMKPLLDRAKASGVDVLVECTSIGVGRNVPIVARLARETGVRLIVPTGVYGRANFAPAAYRAMSEEDLTTWMLREIREGIEDTGIKAGFIKIASSDTSLTAMEEKFLRSAGRAARETGVVIASHTVQGSVIVKQMDILQSLSPSIRFIWVHAQAEANLNFHRQMASRGAFLEFDSVGSTADTQLLTTLTNLISAGYGDRILLSHDAGWYQPGQVNGGTQRGYTYLSDTFIPKLRTRGLSEEMIRRLTVENPRRAFAIVRRRGQADIPSGL